VGQMLIFKIEYSKNRSSIKKYRQIIIQFLEEKPVFWYLSD